MSRSNNRKLTSCDDSVELLLGFAQSADIVKDDLSLFVLLCALGDSGFDRVNHGEGGISVINDFDRIVHTGNNDSGHIRAVIAVNGRCAAAPYEQPTFDGHIIERDFAICCAAADDEVAVHGHILDHYFVGADQDTALDVLVVSTLCGNICADNVVKNLRKFCASDIIQRFQPFGSAVDIIRADHCPDIGQRPVGNLASVGECRQVRFCVCVIIQFQRTGYNCHGLLPRNRRVWGHCRVAAPVISAHLHSHCHIVVVPLGLCHVRVLGNVSFDVAAERPVDDSRHLCTGHIAVGVDDGAGFAVQKAIIHSRRHGFGVPCSTVIVAEIRGLASSRICR